MLSLSRILTVAFLFQGLFLNFAHAFDTHTGRIDFELALVDGTGDESRVDREKTDYGLEWSRAYSTVRFDNQDEFHPTLSLTQDLKSSQGDLLVKAMPVIHFDHDMVNAVIERLAKTDKRTRDVIGRVLTDNVQAKGLDLPFYTAAIDKYGKEVAKNAFDDEVVRTIEMKDSVLADKKLLFRVKLHALEARKGAFPIIGSNDSGNFGTHTSH